MSALDELKEKAKKGTCTNLEAAILNCRLGSLADVFQAAEELAAKDAALASVRELAEAAKSAEEHLRALGFLFKSSVYADRLARALAKFEGMSSPTQKEGTNG